MWTYSGGHDVISSRIPKAFDGFTILHLSDLHVEMSEAAMMRLAAILPNIDYDLCVLTGDYAAPNVTKRAPNVDSINTIQRY
jgi:predicted MPP superfamily phosphohydrolase